MTRIVHKKSPKRPSIFWITVLFGMASLVVMVALLQYRWTKQLIAATEADFGNSLRPLVIGWHLDLYGELSAICVALQVGPDSGAHDAWADYLQRYTQWNRQEVAPETAQTLNSSPDLVQAAYIWETSNPVKPRLLRLAPERHKIVAEKRAPQQIRQLLARLQSSASSLPRALKAWQPTGVSEEEDSADLRAMSSLGLPRWSGAMIGWQFDANIPAVVHPLLHHVDAYDSNSPVRRAAIDWMVVVLNANTIRQRVIPDLTKRYFGSSEGLEYKLAVVMADDPRNVIYSSDADFPGPNSDDIDSKMNIFGTSADAVQAYDSRISAQSLDHHQSNSSGLVWFPVIQYDNQGAPWMLLLRHRTTPLRRIAAGIWKKNLLTGGVVLLLLTIDMGLIVIASRRAHKLAKLQLTFVASVSHELLTPLAAIYCTGQNARDGLLETKADVMEHGTIITDQAHQLIDQLKQVLLFASTESGVGKYSLRSLNVTDIIQLVRTNTAQLIAGRGFTLEEDISPGLPMVIGDLRAVSQCLENLITNAVKYSGSSTWIRIAASCHKIGNEQREVQISVCDRGLGISPSDVSHIFEPFYRGATSLDAQIHGTGLGLAIAKRIADAMGGRLTVSSVTGSGSTFTLHLSIANERDVAHTPSVISHTQLDEVLR